MSDELAVEHVFDSVVARFASDAAAEDPPATPVPQSFGWREPFKRTGTTRIVWVPGDDSSSDLGAILPAREPGREPRRPLATLAELVTVYVEAVDLSDAENERAQYRAARRLFDAWFRAVYLAARGAFSIRSSRWVDDKNLRRYGAALRTVIAIDAMIPDEALESTGTDTRAVNVSILDDTTDGTDETAEAPPAARAATTGPITLDGEQSIDGVAIVAGDRVLVKDQAAGETNGLYIAAVAAWSRAPEADTSAEVESGFFVHVEEGDENGLAGFELTTPDPIVLGTTPLVFERVSP